MCGIRFSCPPKKFKSSSESLKRRGPDSTNIIDTKYSRFEFFRLAITGVDDGKQPFIHEFPRGTMTCAVNGEIYNHKELVRDYAYPVKTKSDCEVVMFLLEMNDAGIEFELPKLNGEYACVCEFQGCAYFFRSTIGHKPLYYGYDEKTHQLEISSCLDSLDIFTSEVLPGRVYRYDMRLHKLDISEFENYPITYNPSLKVTDEMVFLALEKAIIDRFLQCDSNVKVAISLSGGLDSTIVAGVILKYCAGHPQMSRVTLFTFGFSNDAPDVVSARHSVEYFKNTYGDIFDWHCIIGSIEEGLSRMKEVTHALGTIDTTTNRASGPMSLLCREIAKRGFRVLITGEGSDELFGGYLYFMKAPNDVAFRNEIIKLLHGLYKYDVLRADRITSYHSIEVRPPFLDDRLIETVMKWPGLKYYPENTKQCLRKCIPLGLISDKILWGKKGAFSDDVGFDWKKEIGKFTSNTYTRVSAGDAERQFYYDTFVEIFGKEKLGVFQGLWLPNKEWVGEAIGNEPSATALDFYASE